MESPDSLIGKMEKCPVCNRRMKVQDPAVVARKKRESEEYLTEMPEEYFCSVAGVTKEGRQKIVKNCTVGECVFLRQEPDNPYDEYAIAVYVERKNFFGGTKYEQIGYIPSEDAEDISDWMDRGYLTLAFIKKVVGGTSGKATGLRIIVQIHRN